MITKDTTVVNDTDVDPQRVVGPHQGPHLAVA